MIPGIQGIHPVIGASAENFPANGSTPTVFADGGAIGTLAWSSGSVPYPAGVQANDIAIIHANFPDGLSSPGSQTMSAPGDWTEITHQGPIVVGSHTTVAYTWWKRLNGSESGGVTINASEASNSGCPRVVMSVFRGCVTTGTPYEGAGIATVNSSSTHTGPNVTTTGANRLVCNFSGVNSNTAGAPPGDWTEKYDYTTSSGNGGAISLCTKERAAAGTESGCARTMGGSSGGISFGLALIPS